MNALERHNLQAWLRYCEAHPALWELGEIEMPLAQVGLTASEVEALFGRPTLAEVRQAVEEFLEEPVGRLEADGVREVAPNLWTSGPSLVELDAYGIDPREQVPGSPVEDIRDERRA
jgi:hypothetical protein